jgi:methionine sulfoxide reductase heme-binding subunit
MTTMEIGRPSRGFAAWMPWTDRAGRLSPLKLVAFVAVCAPAFLMAADVVDAPDPTLPLLRETGVWSMRLLVATLFVSPLRRITRLGRIIVVRRMLGLAALAYAGAHLLFYVADKRFDWPLVLSEGLDAPYLTLGWLALAGMLALGVTANDLSIRRLGSRGWNRLHRGVYAVAALAIAHFLLEIHVEADEIAAISGLFALSLLFRLLHRLRLGDDGFVTLLALAPLCGLATAVAEAAYFRWFTGVDWRHVSAANFSFDDGLRPGWQVALIGVCVAVLGRAARRFAPPAAGRRPITRA